MIKARGAGITINGKDLPAINRPKPFSMFSMVNGFLMIEHNIFDAKLTTSFLAFLNYKYLHFKLLKVGRWI